MPGAKKASTTERFKVTPTNTAPKMWNSSGGGSHPCLRTWQTHSHSNGGVYSSCIRTCMPSWNIWVALIIHGEMPIRASASDRSMRSTEFYAFYTSMKYLSSGISFAYPNFCSRGTTNIMCQWSIVGAGPILLFQEKDWPSRRNSGTCWL